MICTQSTVCFVEYIEFCQTYSLKQYYVLYLNSKDLYKTKPANGGGLLGQSLPGDAHSQASMPDSQETGSHCKCVCVCVCFSYSVVSDSVTPWTVAHQAPLSMGFSMNTGEYTPEYWSGYPVPSPGDLPYPEIEPRSPALQVDSLPAEPPGKPLLYAVTCK